MMPTFERVHPWRAVSGRVHSKSGAICRQLFRCGKRDHRACGKERMKNAQYEKQIQANKDKANFFCHEGRTDAYGGKAYAGKSRRDGRGEGGRTQGRQDHSGFHYSRARKLIGEILRVTSLSVMSDHEPVERKADISLTKNRHLF